MQSDNRLKLNEMIEKDDIDVKDIDYDIKKAEEEEDNQDKGKKTKPRKYKSASYVLIKTD